MARILTRFFEQLGEVGLLTRDFFRCLFRGRFEARLLAEQLDAIGVRSLNVVNLTALFTGMVLALQTGQALSRFGAKTYISQIMGMSLFREMGPVLTALMLGARVGAGITAELGSMKVTEQIDAMRALATDPVRKLVVPRVLAAIIMLPMLTIVTDAVGLVGGMVIAVSQLGIGGEYFFRSLIRSTRVDDLLSGLGKALCFGYLIAIIACTKGLGTSGGADGVGRATTTAVVAASISILVTDFFLTKLFMAIL